MPVFGVTTITAALGLVAAVTFISVATFYLFGHLRRLKDFQPRGVDQRGYRAERNRVRLEVASIRANVLALLIISIVGVVQIGFEVWRLNFSEQPSTLGPAVEELLRGKMLDAEVLERHHQEVVRTIRELRPSGPAQPDDSVSARLADLQSQIDRLQQSVSDRPPPRIDFGAEPSPAVSSFFSVVTFFVMFALASVAAASWAFLYFLRNNSVISSLTYRGLTTAVTLGSLAGGVVLLKDVSLIKSAEALIKVSISNPSQPNPQPVAPELNVRLYHRLLRHSIRPSGSWAPDCGEGDALRVGPFKDASHLLADEGQKKLTRIIDLLTERGRTERLISITLAGSADKRSLTPETARRYSSNEGLAQARIRVVKDEFLRVFDADTIQVMDHYSGPSKVGSKRSAEELASDRAVQVCVFWGPKT